MIEVDKGAAHIEGKTSELICEVACVVDMITKGTVRASKGILTYQKALQCVISALYNGTLSSHEKENRR